MEAIYWLGFSVFPGVGPKKFQLLIDRFGTAERAWKANEGELKTVLGKALTPQLVAFREKFSLEEYEKQLRMSGVNFLTLQDKDYPALLKEIADPPFVLYVKGNKSILSSQGVAIVGTRKITAYGREVTTRIAEQLVASNYMIVSGLALGVDAVAHNVCLENGGRTVAVLGCGVDCCYPGANKKLYDEIIENNGAIVSEFPLSMQPSLGSFPSRNRIIAGLSQAVVVTEGASDSGALYTTEDAFSVGRKVFAVPGPITSSLSKGPLGLVAKGAQLVTSVDDILVSLGPTSPRLRGVNSSRPVAETKEEQEIIDLLQNESLHIDEIVKRTGSNIASIGTLLSIMEMKGMVKGEDAGMFGLT